MSWASLPRCALARTARPDGRNGGGVRRGNRIARENRPRYFAADAERGRARSPNRAAKGAADPPPCRISKIPIGCSLTLAAAQRVPGLVAAFLSSMVQEHERGVGGWQAEWPTVAAVVQSTGLAIASMAEVAEGLVVDTERMRANIDATRGAIFAERVMMLLGASMGRDVAHKLLAEATHQSIQQKRRLMDVLQANSGGHASDPSRCAANLGCARRVSRLSRRVSETPAGIGGCGSVCSTYVSLNVAHALVRAVFALMRTQS